jgi:hypothetical protein
MAAGIYNFKIEQGATTDFELVYKDSDGNPIDLAGYSARMDLRQQAGASTSYLTLSSSLGPCGTGLNLSGSGGLSAAKPVASGSIGIYISHLSSSALNFDEAFYDLEVVSGSGNCAVVTRLVQGKITLSKEITTGSY